MKTSTHTSSVTLAPVISFSLFTAADKPVRLAPLGELIPFQAQPSDHFAPTQGASMLAEIVPFEDFESVA